MGMKRFFIVENNCSNSEHKMPRFRKKQPPSPAEKTGWD